MSITVENIHKFVQMFGTVSIRDATGQLQRIEERGSELAVEVRNAEEFFFAGQWLPRTAFEELMKILMDTPQGP
jgi:hypothetical protein